MRYRGIHINRVEIGAVIVFILLILLGYIARLYGTSENTEISLIEPERELVLRLESPEDIEDRRRSACEHHTDSRYEDISLRRIRNEYDFVDFARDDTSVYAGMCFTEIVPGADPDTFELIGPNHARDEDSAYYYCFHCSGSAGLDYKPTIRRIEGGDPETLEELLQVTEVAGLYRNFYSRDANNVYYRGHLVEGADPDTFEALDVCFMRDKDTLFVGPDGEPVDADIDPSTYEFVNDRFSKDARHIIWNDGCSYGRFGWWTDVAVHESNSVDAFEILNDAGTIARDDQYVYFRSSRSDVPDMDSFEMINDCVAKDTHRVYDMAWSQGNFAPMDKIQPLKPFPDRSPVDIATLTVIGGENCKVQDKHGIISPYLPGRG